jgi:hypothetical protein
MANGAQCSLKADPAVDVQADLDSEPAVASQTDIVPQTAEDWVEVLFQMIPNCVASTRGYSGPVGLVADVQEYVPLLGRVYWLALQAKYNRQPSLDSRKATFHMEPTIPKNGAVALGALAATTRSQVAKWLMREPGHVVHVEEGFMRLKVPPTVAAPTTDELVKAVSDSSGKKALQAAGLLLADAKKIAELVILFRQGNVSPRMVESILRVAISPLVSESNARVLIQAAYFSANKEGVREAGRKGLEAWAKRKRISVDAAVQQIS